MAIRNAKKKVAKKSPARKRIDEVRGKFKKAINKAAAQETADYLNERSESWVPPKMIDQITDAIARGPKHPVSLSMQEILNPKSEKELFIVQTPTGSISNREEFEREMGLMGYTVIFLEFNPHFGNPPAVIRFERKA